MSFDKDRWSRQSVAMNTGALSVDGTLENGPAVFTYASDSDGVSDVEAADYFAEKAWDLAVGDLILANTSEGYVSLAVSAVTRSDSSSVTVVSAPLSGVAPVQTAVVSVSAAEMLALAATPKEIVAAPGADRIVQFLEAQLILDWGTVAYTITAAGDDMVVRYTDGTGAIVSANIETTGFLDQTADTVTNAIPKSDAIVAATGAVNQPLVLDNIGANEFTLGDSPLRVVVSYKVVNAALA